MRETGNRWPEYDEGSREGDEELGWRCARCALVFLSLQQLVASCSRCWRHVLVSIDGSAVLQLTQKSCIDWSGFGSVNKGRASWVAEKNKKRTEKAEKRQKKGDKEWFRGDERGRRIRTRDKETTVVCWHYVGVYGAKNCRVGSSCIVPRELFNAFIMRVFEGLLAGTFESFASSIFFPPHRPSYSPSTFVPFVRALL